MLSTILFSLAVINFAITIIMLIIIYNKITNNDDSISHFSAQISHGHAKEFLQTLTISARALRKVRQLWYRPHNISNLLGWLVGRSVGKSIMICCKGFLGFAE
jgi:hypothetical protein